MSEANTQAADQQRRYKEFLDLLPLTMMLAGLPASDIGKYFNEEQMELRASAIQRAYKQSRNLVREIVTR